MPRPSNPYIREWKPMTRLSCNQCSIRTCRHVRMEPSLREKQLVHGNIERNPRIHPIDRRMSAAIRVIIEALAVEKCVARPRMLAITIRIRICCTTSTITMILVTAVTARQRVFCRCQPFWQGLAVSKFNRHGTCHFCDECHGFACLHVPQWTFEYPRWLAG